MASTPDESAHAKISLVRTALSTLRELWGDRQLSDIKIFLHVGGRDVREYELHRTVLCSAGYFRSLIKGQWGHSQCGELRPDDPLFDVEAFDAVVRGLYGFEVDVSKGNVLNLLAVGSYLQVEEICEDCKTFLLEELDRMSLADVAQCFATVTCREYPGSDEIKGKSLGLLAAHAWCEARDVLLTLPPSVLSDLLQSNNLWVPDEARRVDLILDLLEQVNEMETSSLEGAIGKVCVSEVHSETCTTVDPCPPDFEDPLSCSLSTSVNPGGASEEDDVAVSNFVEIPSPEVFSHWPQDVSKPSTLRDALLEVLRVGIHYAFIPDSQLVVVQKKLIALGDEPSLDTLRKHFWTRGMFYGTLQGIQDGDEPKQGSLYTKRPWSDAWLRFGVEFKEVELMSAKQQQDSEKVYYAGFLWWVKLRYKERDEAEDMYNAYVCVCNCKQMGGCYVDQGGRGVVDVDATVKDKTLSLGDFNFYTLRFAWGDGRGWAVFKKSNLKTFLTKSGTIRIAIALRLAE